MSFRLDLNDILTTVCLFERIVEELRSYKNAPSHFQNLALEVQLLHKTLGHVLDLAPYNGIDQAALEQVRAIALHCLQPLQALTDKIRVKESSLGHFRTTRSISSIGIRLHWSMIDAEDVEKVRRVILSEMVAINVLLSTQQLHRMNQLSSRIKYATAQSEFVGNQSIDLFNKASDVLQTLSETPVALANLQKYTATQAEQQTMQLNLLDQGLESIVDQVGSFSEATNRQLISLGNTVAGLRGYLHRIKELLLLLANCSKQMIQAIGRNTQALLNIAQQMKQVVRAVEAIPLHLTLDIVRLDDANGESWALPFQACDTYAAFRELLTNVVYANRRPGFHKIETEQFILTEAKTGMLLSYPNWEEVMKTGLHIQQAMVVQRPRVGGKSCPFTGCKGQVLGPSDPQANTCSKCRRWALTTPTIKPAIQFNASPTRYDKGLATVFEKPQPQPRKPKLPPIEVIDELQTFRRVQMYEPLEPVLDRNEALARLEDNENDAAANVCIGTQILKDVEKTLHLGNYSIADRPDLDAKLSEAAFYVNRCVSTDPSSAEAWYILGRIDQWGQDHEQTYTHFQRAVSRLGRSPLIWLSIGLMYFRMNREHDYRSCLDCIRRVLALNPGIGEAWANLGVLYDTCGGQHVDAVDAFQRSLELCPADAYWRNAVLARLEVLRAHPADSQDEAPDNCKIYHMYDLELRSVLDEEIGVSWMRRLESLAWRRIALSLSR